jgi:hypothetical protein
LKPLSKVPFPRPPARTWALITASSPPARALALPSQYNDWLPAHTDVLCDLLSLRSVGCDTALGHANAVLQPQLACACKPSAGLIRTDSSSAADRYSCIDKHRFCWTADCLNGVCYAVSCVLNRNASWRQRLFWPLSSGRCTHVGCADGAGHRPTGAGNVVHGVLYG